MKLLLDENPSDRTVNQILDLYPDSSHVKAHNLTRTNDGVIWSFARQHGFVIVPKDADFYQRSIVHGAPPKFIFRRVGNCPTRQIAGLLRAESALICRLDANPNAAILILP